MQTTPTTPTPTVAVRLIGEDDRPAPLIVKGWRLEVSADARGDFHVALCPHVGVDGAPPEAEDFAGYQYRDIAVRDASAWCDAHPLRVDGESSGLKWWVNWYRGASAQGYRFTVIGDIVLIEGVHVFASAKECSFAATAWCEAYWGKGEVLPPEVPAGSPAVVAAEGVEAIKLDPMPIEKAVAEKAVAEQLAAEAPSWAQHRIGSIYDERVDEVWTLLQQRGEARARKAKVRNALDLAKAQLKAIELELEELDAQVETAVANGPRQRMLPLTPAPRREQAAVADLQHQGPEVPWAFNGVDHIIVIREHHPDGKSALGWRAHLKGHADRTEAFDPERSGAIEACKVRASIVFADAEPGSTAIPTPPKRGKRSKKAEELPAIEAPADATRVIEALRGAMTDEEAAKTLGKSVKTLRLWCAENGIILSEYLGRSTGEDEPARKTSKRGGRHGRGGAT